jgi:hypothetical protein
MRLLLLFILFFGLISNAFANDVLPVTTNVLSAQITGYYQNSQGTIVLIGENPISSDSITIMGLGPAELGGRKIRYFKNASTEILFKDTSRSGLFKNTFKYSDVTGTSIYEISLQILSDLKSFDLTIKDSDQDKAVTYKFLHIPYALATEKFESTMEAQIEALIFDQYSSKTTEECQSKYKSQQKTLIKIPPPYDTFCLKYLKPEIESEIRNKNNGELWTAKDARRLMSSNSSFLIFYDPKNLTVKEADQLVKYFVQNKLFSVVPLFKEFNDFQNEKLIPHLLTKDLVLYQYLKRKLQECSPNKSCYFSWGGILKSVDKKTFYLLIEQIKNDPDLFAKVKRTLLISEVALHCHNLQNPSDSLCIEGIFYQILSTFYRESVLEHFPLDRFVFIADVNALEFLNQTEMDVADPNLYIEIINELRVTWKDWIKGANQDLKARLNIELKRLDAVEAYIRKNY